MRENPKFCYTSWSKDQDRSAKALNPAKASFAASNKHLWALMISYGLMPYVPGFDYDIFVSYAAADNDQGVVEQFIAALEKQISDNLVNAFSKEKVRVYFDRQRLASQAAV